MQPAGGVIDIREPVVGYVKPAMPHAVVPVDSAPRWLDAGGVPRP